jgi:hypothetical protein
MLKKRELLRQTNYNFIKIDFNFPATLASPSFELATLGIESKTLKHHSYGGLYNKEALN